MKKIHSNKASNKISLLKIFEQNLENSLTEDSEKKLKSISRDLLDLFEKLVIFYVEKNAWTELFELIDNIELFFKKNSIEKSRLLRQSEYYHYLGNVFYKINKDLYALNFYNRSLKLSNDSNLLAMESFENLINNLIDRWHYRMINDRIRNEAYRKAICKKLTHSKGKTFSGIYNILDIGGGFGLLSAICLAEAREVFHSLENIRLLCCDMNEIMNEISDKFLEPFNVSKSIKIVNKHSNDLNIVDDFDNQPIQLVVTEIFDDGLLGEGCLDTFYNALVVNKLINRQTSVVPHSASLYLCGIESEYLRKMTTFSEVFTHGDEFKIVNGRCLDNAKEFMKNLTKEYFEFNYEPYTSENIQNIQFSQLTDCIKLEEFNIKFTDPEFLEKYCKYNEITTLEKKLKVKQSGRLDAYLVWFDLNLDEEIILTNSPFSSDSNGSKYRSSCWHHALFTIQDETIATINQEIDVKITLSKECVLVNHLPENLEIKSDKDKANLILNRHEIGLLNNKEYQNFYANWFENIFEKIQVNQTGSKKYIRIGYVSNTFSRILLLLIYEYYEKFKTEKNVDLFIDILLNNDEDTKDAFISNLKNNYLKWYDFIEIKILDQNSEKLQTNVDFIICEPLDFKFGTLRKNILSDLIFIKSINLNKDLEIFPAFIKLKGIFVESSSLLNELELLSVENLCINQSNETFKNIKLKEILSDYATKHLYAISPNNLGNYKRLTNVFHVENIDLNDLDKNFIIDEDKRCEVCIDFSETGRLDAFIYGYELSGKSQSCIYSQFIDNDFRNATDNYAAIFFKEKNLINRKTNASFDFNSRNGFFSLVLKNQN